MFITRKPIFISLSPNTESDDVWLALRFLLQPWQWFCGNAREEAESHFRKLLGVKYAFAFESGRSALYALLESILLEKGEEVLLQAYTCVAVPNAVLWAGAKPVYIDVDPSTLAISLDDCEKKITEKSRALVVQHTFGNPAPMKQILDIARAHDLFVIEDCAHSLGADYRGKIIGSFGHAAFFSFGRDKPVSSVFGGMLVTDSDVVAARVKEHFDSRPLPSRLWILRTLLHPLVIAFIKKTYAHAGIGKMLLKVVHAIRLLPKAVYREEYHGGKPAWTSKKMAPVTARLLLHQLDKLDRFNAHRRALVSLYKESIRSKKIRSLRLKKDSFPPLLRYIVFVTRAKELRAMAKKENIFLGDWYDRAIAPRGVDYEVVGYHPYECPMAESLSRQSLNLPTDINVSEEDAKSIAEFITTHA